MKIKAFRMKKLFTVVSLTGGYCELNCSHCRAKYIRSMLPAPGPRLPRILDALARRGVRGILLSGGWTREGILPVEPYLDALVEAKRRHGFVFNIHLGLETRREVLKRVAEFADIIDYEFTLSKWMVNAVRGLPFSPTRYLEALDAMLDTGLDVVPHVFLWHPGSSRELLRREIAEIVDRGVKKLNLLVYMPPEGDVDARIAEELKGLASYVRELYPWEIYLGCMRPRAARQVLDSYVIEEGIVARIANPSLNATRLHSGKLEFYDACCSVPSKYLDLFREENNGVRSGGGMVAGRGFEPRSRGPEPRILDR